MGAKGVVAIDSPVKPRREPELQGGAGRMVAGGGDRSVSGNEGNSGGSIPSVAGEITLDLPPSAGGICTSDPPLTC